MNETYFLKNTPIANRLTQAQSFAVETEASDFVRFRYCSDEKTIELPLSTAFLKRPYSQVRQYLDDCIRHYLAK